MKISELTSGFGIYTSNEEGKLLQKLGDPSYLNSYGERERVVIENMIRKGLVIKIGSTNPVVVKNEI